MPADTLTFNQLKNWMPIIVNIVLFTSLYFSAITKIEILIERVEVLVKSHHQTTTMLLEHEKRITTIEARMAK
jgi:hypothetical protein